MEMPAFADFEAFAATNVGINFADRASRQPDIGTHMAKAWWCRSRVGYNPIESGFRRKRGRITAAPLRQHLRPGRGQVPGRCTTLAHRACPPYRHQDHVRRWRLAQTH